MIKLQVSKMSCGHCEKAVFNALKAVKGVQTVEINLQSGEVKVEGHDIDPNQLVLAITSEGYDAQFTP